jgi:hypothetical protein
MPNWLLKPLNPLASGLAVGALAVAAWVLIIVPLWRAYCPRLPSTKSLLRVATFAAVVLAVFALGLWTGSSPIGILVTIVSFVITVVGAYFELRSKLSVEPDSPLKSGSIISTPFRVKNESLLSIYNVRHEWLIEQYRGLDGVAEGLSEVGEIPLTDNTIAILRGSESATVYPFDNFSVTEVIGKHLKMLVIITYQTPIFHLGLTKSFIFEGNEGTDKNFHWYHAPAK